MIQGAKRYFIQTYKDSGEVLSPGLTPPSPEDLQSYIAAVRQYVPEAQLRGDENKSL